MKYHVMECLQLVEYRAV